MTKEANEINFREFNQEKTHVEIAGKSFNFRYVIIRQRWVWTVCSQLTKDGRVTEVCWEIN